jgi:hypothetical protein
MARAKKTGEPGWTWRRAMLFGVVIFCLWRMMMLENAADTRLNDSLVFWHAMMAITAFLGYTGLGTVQDVAAIVMTRSGLPYSAQSSPALPTPGTEQGVEGVPPAETVVPATEARAGG